MYRAVHILVSSLDSSTASVVCPSGYFSLGTTVVSSTRSIEGISVATRAVAPSWTARRSR